MTDKFIIGMVGSPFGVKGFVKIRSFSGEIDHLLKLKSVILKHDGREREVTIEESAAAPPSVLMRFAGINSPEAAKTLNGAQLIVAREQAAPLNDGEFYVEDLKGLTVFNTTDETIGKILDIIEGGGGDLAEIQLLSGEKRLIPFRKEFFSEVCSKKGKATLQNLWILE
ncbi:MAG: ribosome maturation factor RimM [Treponema sp.]|nr:ribosome maturation factor RimM [Treponema sp.]